MTGGSLHRTDGIDPDVTGLLDTAFVDDVVTVSDRAARSEVARLASEEGHLVGSSSAAGFVDLNPVETSLSRYTILFDDIDDREAVENFARMERRVPGRR